jgi:hypothetical protein
VSVISRALKNDITIIISVKDSYYIAEKHLEAVLRMAPGVPVIYVLSGPVDRQLEKIIVQAAAENPHVTVVDSGLLFANPYALRNMAIPLVKTRYTLFLFNDIFPHDDDWLLNLYTTAEQNPDVDIFQPFIWEANGKPHAAWNSLTIDEMDGKYIVRHGFDQGFKAVKDPVSEMQAGLQCCFLEDHVFLIRTENLKALSILDPGVAYTKEFLDMALSARFTNTVIWSVPASQVMYASEYALTPGDALVFSYRRCEELSLGSIAYICKKWGISYWTGRIWDTFIDKQLGDISWKGEDIPTSRKTQLEMLLTLFLSIGFNRFSITYTGDKGVETTAALMLPDAYQVIERVAGPGNGQPVSVTPLFSKDVPVFPVHSDDHAGRQRQLHAGKLFPLKHCARGEVNGPVCDVSYKRSSLVECFDLKLQPEAAAGLFAGMSSLVLEKKVDAQYSLFRVFLHARQYEQQKGRFDRFSRDMQQAVNRKGGLVLGGRFFPGAGVRVFDCMENDMLPVELECDDQGWKISYWSWKVYSYSQITGLFNMYRWRKSVRSILQQLRRRLTSWYPLGVQSG